MCLKFSFLCGMFIAGFGIGFFVSSEILASKKNADEIIHNVRGTRRSFWFSVGSSPYSSEELAGISYKLNRKNKEINTTSLFQTTIALAEHEMGVEINAVTLYDYNKCSLDDLDSYCAKLDRLIASCLDPTLTPAPDVASSKP